MRGSRPLRTILSAVLVPLLLWGATACGSGSDTKAGKDKVAADSFGVDPGGEVKAADFAKVLTDAMKSTKTSHLEMTMKLSALEATASGDVDQTTTPPEMAMTISMPMFGDQPMDMRLVDGKLYMNLGTMSGDNFYVIDPNDANSQLGDMSSLTDSYDPEKLAGLYTDGAQKVVYVGEEKVDGASLQHYTLTMDTTKLSNLQDLGSSVTATLPETIDYDMWLDSQNRLSKVAMDLGKDVGTIDLTMSNWNEPVTIEAPPADQVTEMPKSGGLGLGG